MAGKLAIAERTSVVPTLLVVSRRQAKQIGAEFVQPDVRRQPDKVLRRQRIRAAIAAVQGLNRSVIIANPANSFVIGWVDYQSTDRAVLGNPQESSERQAKNGSSSSRTWRRHDHSLHANRGMAGQ